MTDRIEEMVRDKVEKFIGKPSAEECRRLAQSIATTLRDDGWTPPPPPPKPVIEVSDEACRAGSQAYSGAYPSLSRARELSNIAWLEPWQAAGRAMFPVMLRDALKKTYAVNRSYIYRDLTGEEWPS